MFAAIATVAIAIGLVNWLSAAQDGARRGDAADPGRLLFWELSSIAVIVLATPILVLAVRRMRQTPRLPLRLMIGGIALAGFSAVHIAGMVWLRKLVLWALGSSYDFHASFGTLLYEFRKDVVTSMLIGGAVWLAGSRRDPAPDQRRNAAAPVAAKPEPSPAIWLRDGASHIRIEPCRILWVASAGNYIEYRLADGAQHLIRGTLAAAETELAPFGLVRVHRTRLANLARVTGVEFKPSGDFELTFDKGQTLSGSRRYRGAVSALPGLGSPA
jgi:hypothetical protein